ncbi:MAG: TM0106 family RecB-like putative nuclease [Gemmatimonadales bacterium]
MRRLPDGSWTYSPKDLIAWLEGDFAAWCEREAAEHRGTGGSGAPPREPDARDDEMELAVRYGLEHEQQHLDRLRQLHPTLTEIDPKAPDAAAATRDALRRGAPVVFQAVLESGRWMGIADFLHRVEHASGLGDWAYEPWDTKLARSAKPYFLLQLCAYAEMLEATQALRPDRLGFILGDGSESHFRTDDFWHYYRRLKEQFERFQAAWDPQAMPDPGADRGHGRWTAEAERILEERDDLSLVAGISRSMIVRLREAGVETVAALGALAPGHAIPGIAPASLARVREQAAMQLETRASGTIAWRRREPDPDDTRRGLALLPPPSPLDVYYDIEGFPYAPGGLEYLHGATTVEPDGSLAFHDWWAHDEPAEKRAFEQFIDWAWARWQEDPAMHIYHYAAYERTALSRLSTKYGTREWEVDQFLRHDVLVDLLTVVRQGFVIGTPSYSLKDIEHLYMPPRDAEVSSAGASVVEYQKWIDSGEPGDWQHSAILTGLRNYNRDDCDSTAQLAAWLRERQAEAGIAWIPLVEIADATITREPTEAETVAMALLEEALALPDGSDERRRAQMLGWLLEFHRRDEKPMWWRYFERLMMEEQQLVDDLDCLGGLTRTDTPPRPIKKSTGLEYRFDPGQDTRLHVGSDCVVTTYPNLKVSVEALDLERGLVEVKLGPDKEIPDHLSLIPYEYLSAEVIKAAILTYVKRWREDGTVHQTVDDLLVRRLPRLAGHPGGPVIPGTGDLIEETIAAVRALDGGTLAIQGPPGTGKTHTAAHVIAALLRDGKRIGVVANSHAVVNNLLAKVASEMPAFAGGPLWKIGGDAEHPAIASGAVQHTKETKRGADLAATGPVAIGGTAWLFSRPEMAGTLDYLFIDEAGQVSLANAVAVGQSATNLILIGDQMQLAQPTQGVHPGESGLSCLEYLLQGHQTIPAEMGVFLGTSYRMHPDVCRFISEGYYEGRLHSADITTSNRVILPTGSRVPGETGVVFLPVAHDGCTQGSDEEVEVIAGLVDALQDAEVTVKGEPARRMSLDDILIVAPFNMQVRALKARLGPQARIGSVDKFQGQEAPVVIVSMCASTLDDAPRGAGFLLSPNRLNVAISRAQALALVVGSPRLGDVRVRSVEEMKLVNGWCRVEGTEAIDG